MFFRKFLLLKTSSYSVLKTLSTSYKRAYTIKSISPTLLTKVSEYLNDTSDLSNESLVKTRNALFEISQLLKEVDEVKELCASDHSYRDVGESEISEVEKRIAKKFNDDIVQNIIPKQEYDSNPAILEVKPGVGGHEASLFAQEMFDMYVLYVQKAFNFHVEIQEYELNTSIRNTTKMTSTSGIVKASALMTGLNVFDRMKFETGVHRVQRVPITGTRNDRLHTSTCQIAIYPKYDDAVLKNKIDIPLTDLKIEYSGASKPGGQNVNKSESAVRMVHIPSGIVTQAQEEKERQHNQKIALNRLKQELMEREIERSVKHVTQWRKLQMGRGNRNEKIRTYNFNRNQITDHRIPKSVQSHPSLVDFFKQSDEEHQKILINFNSLLKNKCDEEFLTNVLN